VGTENQGIATMLGIVCVLFIALLIVGYAVGKA
jgi:hypothetical protein